MASSVLITWTHAVCPLLSGKIFTVAVKSIPSIKDFGLHTVDVVGLYVPKDIICSFAVDLQTGIGELTCQAVVDGTIVAVGPTELNAASAGRLQLRPFLTSAAVRPGMLTQYS